MQSFIIFTYNLPVIIDCHTHIFPPAVIEQRADFVSRDPCFAELYANPKAKMITAEQLIESMDEAGIDMSVALNIGWRSLELCTVTNDYIMEVVAKYPRRLIGFCAVPQLSSFESVAEIERCVRGGIKGVGEIRPDIELDLSDEYGKGYFLEVMKNNKLILLVHSSEPVGHEYAGKDLITPAVLEILVSRLLGINIICAHWGGGLPFYNLMPEVKKTLSRVCYDSAASPFLYSPQVYKEVAALAGADKILFGSDYPVIDQQRVLNQIKALDMSAPDKEMLLYGNAAKLFDIKTSKV